MGNELEKQYNIKSKPLKLPGAYNFLRFTYHPTLPQSIFIIKAPHKATLMQSSTLILPIIQIKDFSSSNDSFAISPKCVPLALLKPKSQTQMKILMYKILKTGSEIGRCFIAQGRVMVWCEERRSLSSMAPEEIDHGKYSERSKVFTSGVSLLNFLAAVHEERPTVSKKQDKKKKSHSKSQKIILNHSQQKPPLQKQPHFTEEYTAETLPQEIKLFFDPNQPREYFQQLEGLEIRLHHTRFWQTVSEGLRQLIMNMLSREPSSRVELDTILGIPYFQSAVQVKLYFILADGVEMLEAKEQVAFMKALEAIVKIGTVIEPQIMDDYIVPVLVSMASPSSKYPSSNLLSSLAVSILTETSNPPLEVIFNAFRKCPASDRNMCRLCLEKKEKLYFLFQQERFDSIMSRMLFCSYQCDELVRLAVMSTPFVMASIKEDKFKKELEFKLVTRALLLGKDGKASEELLMCGLKCAIELIKSNTATSLKSFTEVSFHPSALSLEANIHLLYLYRLLIQKLPTKFLWPTMMPRLEPYMSEPEISDELFTTAHKLSRKVLDRLHQQRKIQVEEDIQLQYSEEYFKLRDELSVDNKPFEEECKKIKVHIEKHQFPQIGWIATEIF